MNRLVLVVLLVSLIVSACGASTADTSSDTLAFANDATSLSSEPAPSSEGEQVKVGPGELVLSLDDMPAGWSENPDDSDSSSNTDCRGLSEAANGNAAGSNFSNDSNDAVASVVTDDPSDLDAFAEMFDACTKNGPYIDGEFSISYGEVSVGEKGQYDRLGGYRLNLESETFNFSGIILLAEYKGYTIFIGALELLGTDDLDYSRSWLDEQAAKIDQVAFGLEAEPVEGETPSQLGEVATLEEWTVTIETVEKDDRVKAYDAQASTLGYVLTIEGTYTGSDEGDLSSLTVSYVGMDKKVYNSFDSNISYEFMPDQDPQSVVSGGKATWKATLAFPPEAAGNSVVTVEDFTSEVSFEVEAL